MKNSKLFLAISTVLVSLKVSFAAPVFDRLEHFCEDKNDSLRITSCREVYLDGDREIFGQKKDIEHCLDRLDPKDFSEITYSWKRKRLRPTMSLLQGCEETMTRTDGLFLKVPANIQKCLKSDKKIIFSWNLKKEKNCTEPIAYRCSAIYSLSSGHDFEFFAATEDLNLCKEVLGFTQVEKVLSNGNIEHCDLTLPLGIKHKQYVIKERNIPAKYRHKTL